MRALAVLIALAALALAIATVTAAPADSAPRGEPAAHAKKKRACPAGRKGARCRKRARCARRVAARRPKSCPAKRRRGSSAAPPAPAPHGPGSAAPPSGGSPPSVPPPALGRSMSVTAREWSLTTSRGVLAAGTQTIELRNWGEDPHNLVISPDDGSHTPLVAWEEQEPDTYVTQDTGLAAGRYLLWCSLPGHEAAGMATTVRVD